MKPYPSITNVPDEYLGRDCIAFCKLDGSNLRFLWHKKGGWCRFGTRTRLIDPLDPEFGPAIGHFLATLADPVASAITARFKGVEEFILFAEWFGPHSFAGENDPAKLGVPANDPKSLVPFDLAIHKRGLLPPDEFLATLEGVPTAPVVHRGPFDEAFIERVRGGGCDVYEGVIAKGCVGKPPHGLWMCKVKTRRYLDDLRKRYGGDWERHA